MIMLILVVHTFSVGLRGALDLEQSYTVDIHTEGKSIFEE